MSGTNGAVVANASDRLPVSSLYPDRYGVGKTKIYEVLGDLGIEPQRERIGAPSMITYQELTTLDDYMKALREGGKEAGEAFIQSLQKARESAMVKPGEESIAPYHDDPDMTGHDLMPLEPSPRTNIALPPAMEYLVDAIVSRLGSSAQADILYPQEQLSRIEKEGWKVTTPQLIEILGVGSWRDGEERFGFKISKVGMSGRHALWAVSKT